MDLKSEIESSKLEKSCLFCRYSNSNSNPFNNQKGLYFCIKRNICEENPLRGCLEFESCQSHLRYIKYLEDEYNEVIKLINKINNKNSKGSLFKDERGKNIEIEKKLASKHVYEIIDKINELKFSEIDPFERDRYNDLYLYLDYYLKKCSEKFNEKA